MKPTKAQLQALLRVYNRVPLCANHVPVTGTGYEMPISYRQFRRSAYVSFGCFMVKWCGMWLGIEPDGYTHS